jgi:hypothetical protein
MKWVMVGVVALWAAAPAAADSVFEFPEDEAAAEFVANEVIATFYHELGHALIDVLALPVLGREEDAADHLSVILMNDIWEEESAAQILTSDATSYQLMAERDAAGGLDGLFADEHSLNIQRYYNVVCLFYGANPEERAGLADDLGLPPERKDRCPDEYDQAAGSWDAVLQAADGGDDSQSALILAEANMGEPLADLLNDEITTLNETIRLPEQVTVMVADCGEANAFYNPEARSIIMCNEYAEYLQELWDAN